MARTDTEISQGSKITRSEYDRWRYNYPKFDTTGHWAKVPPEGILGDINK